MLRRPLIPVVLAASLWPTALRAQAAGEPESEARAPPHVEVQPEANDRQVERRLTRVLEATPWFVEPRVEVEEGVVFLHGTAKTSDAKQWAGKLAERTEAVVAVVNEMTVNRPSLFEFEPALGALHDLWIAFTTALPAAGLGLFVVVLSFFLALVAARATLALTRRRIAAPLIRELLGKIAGLAVVLFGFYVALRMVGLTRLAVTVIGGTGLLGLIVGIAFRDITENFLASIFLSVQRPFRAGDLVQIAEHLGIVQRLTTRTTVLMTLSGNHVQVPNSIVYKTSIVNFTSNPNRREDFVVGIGYEDSIADAQALALSVLAEHPAVLKNPEPWVLADGLGTSTVNLRVYFWLDGSTHSWLKVRSSVIRLVKRAFQEHGISMPDGAREVIFPEGVPVRSIEAAAAPAPAPSGSENVATPAEADLDSDAASIQEQAARAGTPESGTDLLSRAS